MHKINIITVDGLLGMDHNRLHSDRSPDVKSLSKFSEEDNERQRMTEHAYGNLYFTIQR